MLQYDDHFMASFSQLDHTRKDAAIPYSHKLSILLASIDPKCSVESTKAALRTTEILQLTCEYAVASFIDEYNAKHMNSSGSSATQKT